MLSLLLVIIYFAFISLGLPDALLGAAWPSLYPTLGVPISYAGMIAMIISAGTIVSSLCSDRLQRHFGTGRITAFSVSLTAVALFGFSFSSSFLQLCFWAIPYGLGAGSVDAALNNYVALHYESRHMNWLHCMWGIGASLGPYLMGFCLTHGWGWANGYRSVGTIQFVLSAILLITLPLWKKKDAQRVTAKPKEPSSPPSGLSSILSLPGAKAILLCFFCYSALEATAFGQAVFFPSPSALNRISPPVLPACFISALPAEEPFPAFFRCALMTMLSFAVVFEPSVSVLLFWA